MISFPSVRFEITKWMFEGDNAVTPLPDAHGEKDGLLSENTASLLVWRVGMCLVGVAVV